VTDKQMNARRGLTVISLLERARDLFPDREIVSEGRRIRFEDVYKDVTRIATSLSKLGIKKGDIIGVAEWNNLRFVELLYAAAMKGAVIYPVNVRLPPEQVIYTIRHSGCSFLFASADFAPFANKSGLPEERLVMLDGSSGMNFQSLLNEQENPSGGSQIHEDDAYSILYTSGTTGMPKGVMYTNRKVVLGAMSIVHQLGLFNASARLSSDDTIMPFIPFFHLWAWGSGFHATYLGSKYVLGGKFSVEKAVDAIVKEGVTWINAVPTMVYELLKSDRAGELKGLKILIGGSPVPKGLATMMERNGMKYSTIYGGTDMLATAIQLETGRKIPDSIHPVPFVEASVVKMDGKTAKKGEGEMGELHIRAPWLPDGYYKDPEKSRASFTEDGWFITGDVARLAEDGGIQILDRVKDVIKSGGEWIPTSILESVISEVDGVSSVAVIGKEDPKWGERPVAVVKAQNESIKDSITKHLDEEVQKGRIVNWWAPEEFIFVQDIPMTSVGKIDKKVLKDRYTARLPT